MTPTQMDAYLSDCRRLALEEIRAIVPSGGRYRSVLYDLMLEYPLRESKALRPALCMATCRALGGPLEAVLRSAATLELYHTAFLIHDDVEDGSERRRDRPTLHWTHGAPIAVNVGDALLALALQPLLDNMALLGMGKALRILQVVARMARESTEGQAIELHWIRERQWHLTEADYVRMVYKKTSWYTFVSPVLVGAVVAGASFAEIRPLRNFAALLGIAFQAQDDVLNLVGEGSRYGKEIAGDLWEGKHTLIIMHMMRSATSRERERARRILSKPRPAQQPGTPDMRELLQSLRASGALSAAGKRSIEAALRLTNGGAAKTAEEVEDLLGLIRRHRSVEYARQVALRYAQRAADQLSRAAWVPPSAHRAFLEGLVSYVVDRDW